MTQTQTVYFADFIRRLILRYVNSYRHPYTLKKENRALTEQPV